MECLLKCGGKKTAHAFPQRRPFPCFFPLEKPQGDPKVGVGRLVKLEGRFLVEKVDDFTANLGDPKTSAFVWGQVPGIYPESLLDILYEKTPCVPSTRRVRKTMTSS